MKAYLELIWLRRIVSLFLLRSRNTFGNQCKGRCSMRNRLVRFAFAVLLILLQFLFLSRVRGRRVALFAALMLLLNVGMVALNGALAVAKVRYR